MPCRAIAPRLGRQMDPAREDLPGSVAGTAPAVAAHAVDEWLRAADGLLFGTCLQEIADTAAQELGRPVEIDDRQFRVLAYTEHPDPVDEVRLASILKQELPRAVLQWIDSQHVRTAVRPLRLPPNPRLRMQARVCAPIRCHGHLLGYLWLIDRDEDLDVPALERLHRIAEAAGMAMYRDLLLYDWSRGREREFVRDILSDDAEVRSHAATQLIDHDVFAADGQVAVLVAPLPAHLDSTARQRLRVAADAALDRLRRRMTPRHAAHLLRPDHVLLVAALGEPAVRTHGISWLAARMREDLAAALEPLGVDARVAVGTPASGLADAHVSYTRALHASRVGALVPRRFGDVVSWTDLGIYRVIAELPLGQLGPEVVHPGLRTLIDAPGKHFLLHTLETYLDLAGDAQATAARLFLHRATLYHRLHRIEQLVGVDLADGEDRLALHLGLRIARMQGLEWSESRLAARPAAEEREAV